MSKIRDLPQISALADDDLLYAVDYSEGNNGGRKITKQDLKTSVAPTAAETKAVYESNADTNAFTDAEKAKLATVEANAAFQTAEEVPYDNDDSSLSATNVNDALDELENIATGGLLVTVSSGRIVSYKSGITHYQGTIHHVIAGSLLLDANVTNGTIYVDIDGIIKQTGTNVVAPSLSTILAKFNTNATDVTVLTDERVAICPISIKGSNSDIAQLLPGQSALAGSVNRYADAGHIHNVPTAAPNINLSPASSNAEGSGSSFSRNDHTHAIESGLIADITTILPNDVASVGSVDRFVRADHKHAITTAAPVTQTPDQANAEGSSTSFARADHTHNISTAVATGLTANSTNTQGTSTSFARADHTHAVATGVPSTQNPDQANAAGSSANLARADHTHNVPTAAPVATGSANAQGTSTSFARADHVHNTVLANQTVSSAVDTNTNSLTDVLLDTMTATPAAGTYLVLFNAASVNSGNGAERNYFTIYAGGSAVSNTTKVGIAGGAYAVAALHIPVTVNGSQAIEVRWRVAGGTGTTGARRLTLIRIG